MMNTTNEKRNNWIAKHLNKVLNRAFTKLKSQILFFNFITFLLFFIKKSKKKLLFQKKYHYLATTF